MKAIAMLASRLRALGGVYAKDWLRYSRRIAAPGHDYLTVCNRNERLEAAPGGEGYRCLWQWTSPLHAPTVLRDLGLRLMHRALSDHPVRRSPAPQSIHDHEVDVTFLIGHRGADRLPHLLATLQTIAAQRGVSVECVVVEQDIKSSIGPFLPAWVRHIHTSPSYAGMPYCRSWAFNIGARHATGRVLVLHDGDMLVPDDYASSLVKHVKDGYEVINLKRFIFHLSAEHTARYLRGEAALTEAAPDFIIQNLEGGGSAAITRSGYERIGGMDESFVGWGGEDNEFWERAHTLRLWPYAYLPIVHLWHPAQPGKSTSDNPALRRYQELSATPVAERIARLRRSDTGLMSGPAL
jgi:hypothetical protein